MSQSLQVSAEWAMCRLSGGRRRELQHGSICKLSTCTVLTAANALWSDIRSGGIPRSWYLADVPSNKEPVILYPVAVTA